MRLRDALSVSPIVGVVSVSEPLRERPFDELPAGTITTIVAVALMLDALRGAAAASCRWGHIDNSRATKLTIVTVAVE